jgi:cell wall-associated NlpC family hydrolase
MIKEERLKKLIEVAQSQLGKPYQYGAYAIKDLSENPSGFDCSSFVQFCFKKIGFDDFPRSSIDEAAYKGEEIPSISEAQPGDLIFFEGTRGHYNYNLFNGRKIYIGHVAIYLGEGKVIHAIDRDRATGVVINKLEEIPDYPNRPNNIVLIKRYF